MRIFAFIAINRYILAQFSKRIANLKLDILAIAAHPDDIELACGGTIIKLLKQGRKVGICDLTKGELSTRGTVEIRQKETDEASRLLGISVRENLGLKDGNIENTVDNRLRLIEVIREHQPEILLIPHWLERHPDHEQTHKLAKEAWFYSGLDKILSNRGGKTQQAFRPRKYFHYMQTYEFIPSFIVDISDEFEARMNVLTSYRSQLYDPNSKEPGTFLSTPEFLEMLRTRFEYFGDRIGRKYGEPFFSIEMVRVEDMLEA